MNGSATMEAPGARHRAARWLYSDRQSTFGPDFFPMEARHLHYEASAMIIGLINRPCVGTQRPPAFFGAGAGAAVDLTPPTARLVTDDGERDIPLAECSSA